DIATSDNITWHNPAGESVIDRRFITIHPNPADDVWNVSFNGYKDVADFSAIVTDLNGRDVWQYKGGGFTDNLKINCRTLAQGMYMLKLNIDGIPTIRKLLK